MRGPRLSSSRWERTRQAVLLRDGHRCRACHRFGVMEVDHIIPRVRLDVGEYYKLEACQTLCKTCHQQKTRQEHPYFNEERFEYRQLLRSLLGGHANESN